MNMEKVFKGFECCHVMVHDLGPDNSSCGVCPYKNAQTEEQLNLGGIECIAALHDDAIALLKEQKDKLDHIVEFKKGDVVQTFNCYFCHTQYRAVLKGHETIHCKECEHYTPHGSSGICGSWGEWCDPDEWCSRAVLLTEVRRYDNQ